MVLFVAGGISLPGGIKDPGDKLCDAKGLNWEVLFAVGGMRDPIINGEKLIGILAMVIEDGLSTSFVDLFGERNTAKGLKGDFGFSTEGVDSCFLAPKFNNFIVFNLVDRMSLTGEGGVRRQQLTNCLRFYDF